jgi:hypothetical protein
MRSKSVRIYFRGTRVRGTKTATLINVRDQPKEGDVLITSRVDGRYLLSVVPYPYRLSFGSLGSAIEMATAWAVAQNVSVWHTVNSETSKVRPTVDSAGRPNAIPLLRAKLDRRQSPAPESPSADKSQAPLNTSV